MFAAWQKITLWKRVLVGLFLGLALGLAIRYGLPAKNEQKSLRIQVVQSEETKKEAQANYLVVASNDLLLDLVRDSVFSQNARSIEASAGNGRVKLEGTKLIYNANPDFAGTDEIKLQANEPFGNAERFGTTWFKPFGDLFVRLIRMLIIPLILTTLVSGVTAMGDPKRLGSLGFKTIVLYLATTFFAVALGLIIGTILRPGAGIDISQAGASSVSSVQGKIETAQNAGSTIDRLLAIVPTNPVQALATNDVLATIFFAVVIGIGILVAGEKGKLVGQFFDAAAEVVMRVTVLIMELAPYGVLALMAWVMATSGIEVLVNLLWLTVALYLACGLQILLVYGGIIITGVLRLPLIRFFRGVADAQGVAFSTSSSSATLPMTISCAEKNLGVEKSVAGSVLPLGATINMDGTAIYLGLIALFASQALGNAMTPSQYLMVALMATLVSIGAAGIPSAGLLLAASVLDVVGVQESQAILVIALIFPFDRLLDMMRTVTNVTGDLAVACTVANWEGVLDKDIFRQDNV